MYNCTTKQHKQQWEMFIHLYTTERRKKSQFGDGEPLISASKAKQLTEKGCRNTQVKQKPKQHEFSQHKLYHCCCTLTAVCCWC